MITVKSQMNGELAATIWSRCALAKYQPGRKDQLYIGTSRTFLTLEEACRPFPISEILVESLDVEGDVDVLRLTMRGQQLKVLIAEKR